MSAYSKRAPAQTTSVRPLSACELEAVAGGAATPKKGPVIIIIEFPVPPPLPTM